MKVAVVGAGSWGTTLASLLSERSETLLWAREPEVVESIGERHENEVFLPGYELSPALRASNDLDEVLSGAGLVVMAVPSQFFRSVLQDVGHIMERGTTMISVVKGIEQDTYCRMTEIIEQELDPDMTRVGVLSGPNVAREVIAGQPALTVIAMPDEDEALKLQQVFNTRTLRVYTNPDVIGCEIGGSVKNVLAIAAGVAHGLGYGENTKAALITRGLAELTRLGIGLGGRPLTFLGLAGNGDLIATCSSPFSRNRSVGTQLGQGRQLDDIIADMHMVAEGVKTSKPVAALAARIGVDMPIAFHVGEILYEGRKPADVVEALMGRDVKSELADLGD